MAIDLSNVYMLLTNKYNLVEMFVNWKTEV